MKNIILFITILYSTATFAYAHVEDYPPKNYVNDYASVIDDSVENSLNTLLQEFEASTTHQVAVLTVDHLEGDIESFAYDLFKAWGIGRDDVSNGVLIVLAPNERKVRIEVGLGLEGVLTDLKSSRIIREEMSPYFANNDFTTGIDKGVRKVVSVASGEAYEVKQNKMDNLIRILSTVTPFGIVILIFIYQLLASSKSWWFGGVLGAVSGGLLSFLFGYAMFTILGMAILGLIVDYFASKWGVIPQGRGGYGGWHSGGGFSSSSSGGFGGFGGGRSGGGGASGGF